MPRENSFSDSDGRSLTPDINESESEAIAIGAPLSPTGSRSQADAIPKVSVPVYKPIPIPSKPEVSVSVSRVKSRASSNRNKADRTPVPAVRPGPDFNPKAKWQTAYRKIIQMRRSTKMLTRKGIGAEPGVDPRRESAFLTYGHIKKECVIEVVDYSAVRRVLRRMGNREFVELLGHGQDREGWVKVRWINVGGVSFDVVSALALKYDLHPLAIEDVLHQRGHARSKADYYRKHLFLRVLCHQLTDEEDEVVGQFLPAFPAPAPRSPMTNLPRSSSPVPFTEEDKKGDFLGSGSGSGSREGVDDEKTLYYGGSAPNSRRGLGQGMATLVNRANKRRKMHGKDLENGVGAVYAPQTEEARNAAKQERMAEDITVEELKKGARVPVKVSPVFIFLLRDGTVISMSSTPNLDMTTPITARINQPDSLLRKTADPSLLVQSLLDLLVDQVLEVIDGYHVKIKRFEHSILLKPSVKAVRNLHILSGDLILHKRTLEPIKTIIYGLRRYDLDRCAALVDRSIDPNAEVVGFMSHTAKIYLADVYDHMEYSLTSLDMFAGISENLIDYTFNMASYEMNETMRRLTLATIIFLPLTLLTGYFGMNFQHMWTINHEHTDVVFWIIALPLMAIVGPLFMWNDIVTAFHYIKQRMQTRKAVKTFKQA